MARLGSLAVCASSMHSSARLLSFAELPVFSAFTAAQIGRIEKTALKSAADAMHDARSECALALKLDADRAQKRIAILGRERFAGIHHNGEFRIRSANGIGETLAWRYRPAAALIVRLFVESSNGFRGL